MRGGLAHEFEPSRPVDVVKAFPDIVFCYAELLFADQGLAGSQNQTCIVHLVRADEIGFQVLPGVIQSVIVERLSRCSCGRENPFQIGK